MDNSLTPEKGELIGSLMGDKGVFKIQRRHGFYRGYDLSKYTRCSMSVCLGRDREWGEHISRLMSKSYGVHGTTYIDGREYRFWSSSSRVFHDLANYYSPSWNCHRWRVIEPIFRAPLSVREGVIRGYFSADGYPDFSNARDQVSLKATTVNKPGADSMRRLLETIGFRPGVYRRYKVKDVWELCVARQADVLDFYNRIGFSIARKQTKLRSMLVRKGILGGKKTSEGRI